MNRRYPEPGGEDRKVSYLDDHVSEATKALDEKLRFLRQTLAGVTKRRNSQEGVAVRQFTQTLGTNDCSDFLGQIRVSKVEKSVQNEEPSPASEKGSYSSNEPMGLVQSLRQVRHLFSLCVQSRWRCCAHSEVAQ